MHWARVINKYPQAVEQRHIMALFQRTYIGHLHNLAKARTRDAQAVQGLHDNDASNATQPPDDTELLIRLAKAPASVRALAKGLVVNARRLRAPNRIYRDGRRETLNDKLCAIAGIDPTIDLRNQLLELLK